MFDWISSYWIQLKPFLVPFGGLSAVIIAISAYISRVLLERSIETKKSELGRETERLKGKLNQELTTLSAKLTRETNDELERLKSTLSQETDLFRLKIKKQEILFNMQIDATREFMKITHQIWPDYSHPDMDWEEATAEAAKNLYKTEKILNEYIIKHGAALEDMVLLDIRTLQEIASNYKFDAYETGQEEVMLPARKKAGELLMKIKKIENDLLNRLRN